MPYFGDSPKTLLVDGTDLQAIDGIVVRFMELLAPGTRRSATNDGVIPGRPGQLGAELPYDAYAFSIGITVLGDDEASMLVNLRAVAAACAGTNGLVALTRRLAKVGGGYDTHTANGQFVTGLAPSILNTSTGETELQFVNLDGAWFDASAPTTPIVP